MIWIDTPESSNITKFGYDQSNQIMLVEFKNGSLYKYFDVPETIYEQMKTAPSKGRFLSQNIKGLYRYARA